MSDKKIEIRVNTGSAFGNRYLPVTKPDLVEGLLDQDNNIKAEWFADWMTGARRMVNTITSDTTLADLFVELQSELFSDESEVGKYFVSNGTHEITLGSGIAGEEHSWQSGEEGASGSITVEQEDVVMLVRREYNSTTEVYDYEWGVMNNTYATATGSVHGIVKLSDSTVSLSGTGSAVAATPSAVKAAYDLAASKEDAIGAKGSAFNKDFGTGEGEVAEGNHTHDYDNFGGFTVTDESGSSATINSGGDFRLEGAGLDVSRSGNTFAFTPHISSTSVKGLIETATVAEAKEGTDTSRAITAEGLFASALPYFSSLTDADAAAADYPTGKIVIVEV